MAERPVGLDDDLGRAPDHPSDHSTDGTGRLVRMANQIATFFATQPSPGQSAEVAGHLKAFWEPRMIQAILAHAEAGGEGLSPLAREAVERLRAPR